MLDVQVLTVILEVPKQQNTRLVVLRSRDGREVPRNKLCAPNCPHLRSDRTGDFRVVDVQLGTSYGASHDGGRSSENGDEDVEHHDEITATGGSKAKKENDRDRKRLAEQD